MVYILRDEKANLKKMMRLMSSEMHWGVGDEV